MIRWDNVIYSNTFNLTKINDPRAPHPCRSGVTGCYCDRGRTLNGMTWSRVASQRLFRKEYNYGQDDDKESILSILRWLPEMLSNDFLVYDIGHLDSPVIFCYVYHPQMLPQQLTICTSRWFRHSSRFPNWIFLDGDLNVGHWDAISPSLTTSFKSSSYRSSMPPLHFNATHVCSESTSTGQTFCTQCTRQVSIKAQDGLALSTGSPSNLTQGSLYLIPSSLDRLHLKLQHQTAEVGHRKSTSSRQAGELEQVHATLGNATLVNTAQAVENGFLTGNMMITDPYKTWWIGDSIMANSWKSVLESTEVLNH